MHVYGEYSNVEIEPHESTQVTLREIFHVVTFVLDSSAKFNSHVLISTHRRLTL